MKAFIELVRTEWHLNVTCRPRWKWVQCRADRNGMCCYGSWGPEDGEFMGCQADRFNDWIAERFYRRWVANFRLAVAKAGSTT